MRTSEERVQRILEKTEIEERRQTRARRKKTALISTVSCAVAAVLALNLTLFVPYTAGGYNISKYRNSEYYGLMSKIGELTYRPYRTNNFWEWIGIRTKGDMEAMPPTSDNTTSNGKYEEVTNNQVAGVIEGDLFKRSSEYIWYVGNTEIVHGPEVDKTEFVLRTYSIAKKELASEYYIAPEEGTAFLYFGDQELFLSEDCQTLTLIAMCRSMEYRTIYTEVIKIDVSNPTAPQETFRKYVSGEYVSARMMGDTLLLVTSFRLGNRPNFDNEEEYIPQFGDFGKLESLPMEDIVCPEDASVASYTTITSFDAKTLDVNDCEALFSYTSDVYVSAENLYVTRNTDMQLNNKFRSVISATEITRIAYTDDSLALKSSVTVKGDIVNQYSLDEYENVLRVFTTSKNNLGENECNLYCFALDDFELVASVENFSDPDERVMSVRFDGEKAHVCTAYVATTMAWDPVFEFDLSDYNHITWKDTGTIPGYSLSLIKFTDDTLLGIGYGDDRSVLKIELYRTNDSTVESTAKYELSSVSFSSLFKAYLIDAKQGLIGLGIRRRVDFENQHPNIWFYDEYLLLRFDGETLTEILRVSFEDHFYNFDTMRACYIDGSLFIFSRYDFTLVELDQTA